ncbi:solute carrier family 23 protein [Gordonia sp. VNK1]|uniref:SulP family inorganic anion transporter n=1 Tax=Gordonia oleivorans TaxID=3156618 RepID=UPI0032B524B1
MASWLTRIRRPRLARPTTSDAASGLVTALFSIPEGMAYAAIGGFNPVAGLYSGMLPTLVGSMLSRTVLMVTTLTSAIALSAQSVLASAGLDAGDVGNLAMLTLLVGAFMLILGLLKVGAIMDFVSSAVMTGFTVGIAIQIVAGAIKDVTGYTPDVHNTVMKFVDALAHIASWSVAAVLVAVATIAVWAISRFVRPLRPFATLIALLVVTVVTAVIGTDVETVGNIASVPNELPPFTLPDVSAAPHLLLGAFAIALVALAQAAGISAAVPNPDGTRPDASGDFSAQGTANVVGSLFGALPTGGSLSRTGVAVSAGAQTRWAGMFAGVWLILLVLIAGSAAQVIPMAVIGALLIVIGLELIEGRWDDIRLVFRSAPLSAAALLVTLVATTQIPLQNAILLGAVLSLIVFCVQAARAASLVTLRPSGSRWEVAPVPDVLPAEQVTVLHYSGSSLFAEVPRVSSEWPAMDDDSMRCVVILSVRTLPDVPSATVLKLLIARAKEIRERHGRFMIAGVGPEMRRRFDRTGVTALIGEDNIVMSTDVVFGALDLAYAEGRRWLDAQSTD